MATKVTIEVGKNHFALGESLIPPIGTRVTAHKHLYDGGTYPILEVVEHEWRLSEADEAGGLAFFDVTVKTKIVG